MSKFSFPEHVVFRHIRLYDNNDMLSSTGGYTAAYYIDRDEQVVDFAIAKCRDDELFDRKKGRETALERLIKYRDGGEVITADGLPMAYTVTAQDLSKIVSKDFSDGLNEFIADFLLSNFREEVANKEIATFANAPSLLLDMRIEEFNIHVIIDQIESFIEETGL